jgi:hypothetical protein
VNEKELFHLKIIHRRYRRILHALPNVVGTMISTKKVNGKDTGISCITVLVVKKLRVTELGHEDTVPEKLEDVVTDVVESGKIRARQTRTQHIRPAPRGVSIGHYLITAGTLGCIVYKAGVPYILSNNHVLANENNANVGDPILQPGAYDGGTVANDEITQLYNFIKIIYDGQTPSGCTFAKAWVGLGNGIGKLFNKKTRIPKPVSIEQTFNTVDCAIAGPIVLDTDAIDSAFEGDKIPTATMEAAVGQSVYKSGRTTGLTTGTISGIDATVDVGYGNNNTATFEQQLVSATAGMSQGGDSGSLLQDSATNNAVGLLFAGSDTTTIFNQIDLVLEALGVTIA